MRIFKLLDNTFIFLVAYFAVATALFIVGSLILYGRVKW